MRHSFESCCLWKWDFKLIKNSEAVVRRCSAKKMFLEILHISLETSLPESLCSLRPATLLKKRAWHSCFPVNFAKFLGTPSLTEHLRWMLLKTNSAASSLSVCWNIRITWNIDLNDLKSCLWYKHKWNLTCPKLFSDRVRSVYTI